MKENLHIPSIALTPYPLAVRVTVNEEKLEELAETVKTHGMIEPLIARPSKAETGKYEVVCGLRRFLAARKAGLETVPCIVKEMSDLEAMEAMLVENLQREDLSDYEVGRWFKLLLERFPDKYPSQQAIANSFKLSVQHVNELIKHYEFLKDMKSKLPPNISARAEMLPEAMVREIRRAPEDLQPKIVKAVCRAFEKFECGEEEYLPSVRDVAKLVNSYTTNWERELKAIEEKREAEKPERAEALSKPEVEQPQPPKTEGAPPPPTAPTPPIPSEEEVGARLDEVMRKHRKEEQRKREEAMVTTLHTYYPEKLISDVESFCGSNIPPDKLQKFIYYTVEIAWNKLPTKKKTEVLLEAKSWTT